MGVLLFLLCFSAIVEHSRFGEFNSRLGPNKFPFRPTRELAGKGLIWLAVLGADKALFGNNQKRFPFRRE
jgi:hypothetical protein